MDFIIQCLLLMPCYDQWNTAPCPKKLSLYKQNCDCKMRTKCFTKRHLLNLDLDQIMLAWSLDNPWLPNFPANGISVYPK